MKRTLKVAAFAQQNGYLANWSEAELERSGNQRNELKISDGKSTKSEFRFIGKHLNVMVYDTQIAVNSIEKING